MAAISCVRDGYVTWPFARETTARPDVREIEERECARQRQDEADHRYSSTTKGVTGPESTYCTPYPSTRGVASPLAIETVCRPPSSSLPLPSRSNGSPTKLIRARPRKEKIWKPTADAVGVEADGPTT